MTYNVFGGMLSLTQSINYRSEIYVTRYVFRLPAANNTDLILICGL